VIKSQRTRFEVLDDLRPGDEAALVINRDGTRYDVKLTLGGREDLP
jgi:hypothetical protein